MREAVGTFPPIPGAPVHIAGQCALVSLLSYPNLASVSMCACVRILVGNRAKPKSPQFPLFTEGKTKP